MFFFLMFFLVISTTPSPHNLATPSMAQTMHQKPKVCFFLLILFFLNIYVDFFFNQLDAPTATTYLHHVNNTTNNTPFHLPPLPINGSNDASWCIFWVNFF